MKTNKPKQRKHKQKRQTTNLLNSFLVNISNVFLFLFRLLKNRAKQNKTNPKHESGRVSGSTRVSQCVHAENKKNSNEKRKAQRKTRTINTDSWSSSSSFSSSLLFSLSSSFLSSLSLDESSFDAFYW